MPIMIRTVPFVWDVQGSVHGPRIGRRRDCGRAEQRFGLSGWDTRHAGVKLCAQYDRHVARHRCGGGRRNFSSSCSVRCNSCGNGGGGGGGGGGGSCRHLFVGCLASQQHASVSQGRICKDNFTCCHTEIEVADQTFYLTQSRYTDTGPTSPSADPIMPGVWQGSHWSANF